MGIEDSGYGFGRATSQSGCLTVEAGFGSKGWVAECIQGSALGTWDRQFLSGDKSDLSGKGNGSVIYDNPGDGFYEADGVVKSQVTGRFYVEIRDGQVTSYGSELEFAAALWRVTPEELRVHRDREKAAAIAVTNAKASELEAALGNLPELQGSDKQVTWAKAIRAKAVSEAESAVEQAQQRYDQEAAKPHGNPRRLESYAIKLAEIKSALAALRSQGKASWWIDNRSASTRTLMLYAASQEPKNK